MMRAGRFLLGLLALVFYSIHNGHCIAAGRAEDILWSCNLAPLLIGVGLLVARPAISAIGTLWLTLGLPLWLLDLVTGGTLDPTSILTHVGGLVIGVIGGARFGVPRGSWWRAHLALVALHILCHVATPPASNVNLSHSVWAGWESVFPSFALYQALLLGVAAVVFLSSDLVIRRAVSVV